MKSIVFLAMASLLQTGATRSSDGPPYPTLNRTMIETCEPQFTALRSAWADRLQTIPHMRTVAAADRARNPMDFYVDGWSDGDGTGGGGLTGINRDIPDLIGYYRGLLTDSPPSDLDAYGRAYDNAEVCVARVIIAAYDTLHGRAPTSARAEAPPPAPPPEPAPAPSSTLASVRDDGDDDDAPGVQREYINPVTGRPCVTEVSRTQRETDYGQYIDHKLRLSNSCSFTISVRVIEIRENAANHERGSPVYANSESEYGCLTWLRTRAETSCAGFGRWWVVVR